MFIGFAELKFCTTLDFRDFDQRDITNAVEKMNKQMKCVEMYQNFAVICRTNLPQGGTNSFFTFFLEVVTTD